MSKAAWMTTKSGFEKVTILAESERSRTVRIEEGKRTGEIVQVPPAGLPNRDFNPPIFEGEQPPQVWRYKGRCLPLVNPGDFKDLLRRPRWCRSRSRSRSSRTPPP